MLLVVKTLASRLPCFCLCLPKICKTITPVQRAKFEMTCSVHIFRLQDLAINKESVDKECQGLQQTIMELDATCQVKSICYSIMQKN